MGKIIRSVIKRVWWQGKSLTIQVLSDKVASNRLLGLHQIENAGMAIALLDTFVKKMDENNSNDLSCSSFGRDKLAWGVWRSCQRTPWWFWMGPTNPHAIKALLATLQERFADYHKEILFTCIKTKALEDMLDLLGAIPDTELTLTHFEDSPGDWWKRSERES